MAVVGTTIPLAEMDGPPIEVAWPLTAVSMRLVQVRTHAVPWPYLRPTCLVAEEQAGSQAVEGADGAEGSPASPFL